MKFAMKSAFTALSLSSLCLATPLQSLDFGVHEHGRRGDADLAGYLGTFFLGSDPYVYFYLSDGNEATSFTALNGGEPVMKPSRGTGGARDPAIVVGGGSEEGRKWYILATDLNISATNWDAAQRQGSKSIFVWESDDLVNWSSERLVEVEDASAGMVWAPDAIWDHERGEYLVHWASKFYGSDDTEHVGDPSPIYLRYAYTSDFKSFSAPQTYIDKSPTDVIDLNILPLGGGRYVRFLKDETLKTVFCEISENGLFGDWLRPGGEDAIIESHVEGPAAYHDNLAPGKIHLLLDFYSGNGYVPYEVTAPVSNSAWTASNSPGFPTGLRHGSVLPVNSSLYDALAAKWA